MPRAARSEQLLELTSVPFGVEFNGTLLRRSHRKCCNDSVLRRGKLLVPSRTIGALSSGTCLASVQGGDILFGHAKQVEEGPEVQW